MKSTLQYIEIKCRSVRIVRLNDSPTRFDLTGRDNETVPETPAQAANGGNAEGTFRDQNRLSELESFNDAQPGSHGAAGKDGARGNDGGHFSLQANIMVDGVDQPWIEIDVSGGGGGRGGQGAKGGKRRQKAAKEALQSRRTSRTNSYSLEQVARPMSVTVALAPSCDF